MPYSRSQPRIPTLAAVRACALTVHRPRARRTRYCSHHVRINQCGWYLIYYSRFSSVSPRSPQPPHMQLSHIHRYTRVSSPLPSRPALAAIAAARTPPTSVRSPPQLCSQSPSLTCTRSRPTPVSVDAHRHPTRVCRRPNPPVIGSPEPTRSRTRSWTPRELATIHPTAALA